MVLASEERNISISSESGLWKIDHQTIEKEIKNSRRKRHVYVKYSPEDCDKIRKFQKLFLNMNESAARTFRKESEHAWA